MITELLLPGYQLRLHKYFPPCAPILHKDSVNWPVFVVPRKSQAIQAATRTDGEAARQV